MSVVSYLAYLAILTIHINSGVLNVRDALGQCTRSNASATSSVPECLRVLKTCIDKHRMMIGEMAIRVLHLYDGKHSFLMILVHSRHREHFFYTTDVAVVPYTVMPPGQAEDMRIQSRQEKFKRDVRSYFDGNHEPKSAKLP